MRYSYNNPGAPQDEFDSLPRLSLTLKADHQHVEATGLLDSGATVNVMPYSLGLALGALWDEQRAIIPLTGNLGSQLAIPFFCIAEIAEVAPTRLAFAWVKVDTVPLIFGQTNFFIEFDVCFYRSKLEFEIKRRS